MLLPSHQPRVAVEVERRVENVNRFRSGREGMKARDIRSKYPEPKATQLIEMLRKKNMWYWDEDFPEDEEEP